ncbi:hypothetical protein [Actinophytocola xanthii]|uniref:Uncharacterized protein n=1 Tax=Actinophytocola xanthii TaxID=1912961 RepID=A0A1Q8CKC4_9PSEU|nr:hypothetical protein [Actinophytocola xanthii]OLF14814.1 hypothetical protein BU204_24950 [Actinophytocola xanthii]
MRGSELELAWSVPRWAARFFRRHWRPIVGLSLVASVQRLVVVNWTDEVPEGLAVASEVLVALVRLALLVLVWRYATQGVRLRWSTARAFLTRHWPSLVWQVVLLSAAFLVFDVGLESLGGLFSESGAQTYLAVLLFLKNPTIIAFTLVWWVGVIRQVAGEPVPAGTDSPHRTSRVDAQEAR